MRLFIFSLLLLSFTVHAEDAVKIIFLKGAVSYQRGEGASPVSLKMSDALFENDIVITDDKSILKIRFSDGGVLSIAPRTKIKIEKLKNSSPKLVTLLAGKLRAQIKKHHEGDYSFFIKTKTGTLGVRGTDFNISYNEKNSITSTITFVGEVAFVSSKSSTFFDSPDVIEEYDDAYATLFEERLGSDRTKIVRPGEFSGAYPGYKESTVPVSLSKVQFEALLNSDETVASTVYDEVSYQAAAPSNEVLVPRPRSEYTAENYPTNVLPTPGGYLDLETGFYVPPPENSSEIPVEYGTINKKTGDYIPPEGVTLDPLKGFVLIGEIGQKTLLFVNRMNTTLKSTMEMIKEITRLDVMLEPALYYESNVTGDFYGRLMRVTNHPSWVLLFDGFLGHKTLDTKNWLIYPKGKVKTLYHYNQEERSVNLEDSVMWTAALEVNHRYLINHRKGHQIFEFGKDITYRDLVGADQYRFYTEDLYGIFGQEFKLHDKHTTRIWGRYLNYDTFDDERGEIWSGHFLHRVDIGRKNDLHFEYNLSREFPKRSYEVMISDGAVKHIRKNLFDNYLLESGIALKYTDFRKVAPNRGEELTFRPSVRIFYELDDYLKISLFYLYNKNISDEKNTYHFESFKTGGELQAIF